MGGLIKNPLVQEKDTISLNDFMVLPVSLYLCWQIFYWLITEVALKSYLAEDPQLITSLRYLTKDKKNGFRNLCMFLLQKIGVNREDEDLDPDSLKTKATFGGIQLIYTIITIIPTPFLF